MTSKNPPVGKFVNWKAALVGNAASSNALGEPLVKTFNHLRRYRAMEYIASYSGRYDPAINGNWASRFHIITRFPVRRATADAPPVVDAQVGINLKTWKIGRGVAGPINLLINWRKVFGGGITTTLKDTNIPVSALTDDGINSSPDGFYGEWAVELTPVAIGTADGFRCSRLDVDNQIVHRLNVFGCPHEEMLDDDEALVSLSDVAVGEPLRGWVDGTADGTIGALCHYMDGDSSDAVTGTDSVIHNTSRALFNTPYALGVHLTNEAAYIPIRSDGASNSMTYKVKPRDLTGAGGNVACDVAVVVSGDIGARIKFTSSVANVTYTLVAGDATPTLRTTTDFSGTLNVAAAGDHITIEALSGAGNDIYIHAVSLWEPYQYR